MVQIDNRIEQEFVPHLARANSLFPERAYKDAAKITLPNAARDPDKVRLYALARIPDFAQASHIASQLGKPVFSLTGDDLKQAGLAGNVKTSVQQNVQTFDQIFSAICDKILTILRYE